MQELLTIGEVARRSGVAASALRFYEERGLIASERAGSGHRRFARPVLRRIAFIVFAQRVGLTLDEIHAELAKLPPHRAPNRRDWERLSSGWVARIDARIAELERAIDECDRELEPLAAFILPGGTPKAAALHVARTVCRRAERRVVALERAEELPRVVVVYLNRLSDLLFVLARVANRRAGAGEVTW